jgi:uncharacterized metal-binding protein YceD (DUF177 family)
MSRNRKTPQSASPDPDVAAESPLKRIVKVETIRDGQEEIIEAKPDELSEIASLQDLKALESLVFTYTLRKASGGSVRLKGRLQADATQTCVVTLEPVEAPVDMPVQAEFWPLRRIQSIEREQAEAGSEADPLADWPEPIVDGTVDLGTLIYETFALALDPYPRREGGSLEWQNEGGEDDLQETRENPFAALEKLKKS